MKTLFLTLILCVSIIPNISCKKTKSPASFEDPASLSPSASLDPSPAPVTSGSWYKPNADNSWQWQLKGEINTTYEVDLYDVDLFDVSDQTLAMLKSKNRKIICYFSAGSSEDWRPDYADILESSKGKPLDDWPGERWLDIRAQNVLELALKRLDLAVARGCDGVEPDNMDAFANESGFALSAEDQLAFNRRIANEAHQRGLAVGLKNDGDQTDALLAYFDFSVNEQCHEYDECEVLTPFVRANKPIFNAEYKNTPDLCARSKALGLKTLVLPLALDDSSRVSCD